MKRIALAAAAALVGTGCFVSDSDPVVRTGSVNVYWDFVRNAPAAPGGIIVYDDSDTGSPDGACNESAVDLVEVDSPVGNVAVDCVYGGVEGVGIDFVPEGTRPFRFRGWRGAVLVYDVTVNLDVHADMVMDYSVDLLGVSAPLDLFAYLRFDGAVPPILYATCGEATPVGSSFPPDIGYEIRDAFGNLVDADVVGCDGALPAPVFVGDLELDDYSVRMRGYVVETRALVFDSCEVPLAHFGSQIGAEGLAPVLRNPIPACP